MADGRFVLQPVARAPEVARIWRRGGGSPTSGARAAGPAPGRRRLVVQPQARVPQVPRRAGGGSSFNLRRACRRSCGRPAGCRFSTSGARAAGSAGGRLAAGSQPQARVPQVPRAAGWLPVLNLRRACRRFRGRPAGVGSSTSGARAAGPAGGRLGLVFNLRRVCRRSCGRPAGCRFSTSGARAAGSAGGRLGLVLQPEGRVPQVLRAAGWGWFLNLRRACRRSCGRPAGVGSSTCGARAAGPCEWPARPRFQPEARVPQVPRRAGGMFVLQPVARAPEVARGWRPSVVPQVPRVACWGADSQPEARVPQVPAGGRRGFVSNLRRACRRSGRWPAGIRFQPEARVPQVRPVAGGDSFPT